MIFALILLIIVAGFSGAYFLLDNSGDNATQNSNQQIAVNQQKQNGKNQPQDAQAQQGSASVNPFVDVSALPKVGSQNNNNVIPGVNRLPAVPSSSRSSNSNSYSATPRPSLPSIPSSPRVAGTIPSVQKPSALPTPSAPAQPSAPAEVQGVITGNDGQNMAIMSDGTVVSEGESYNDGRIAYIGGDGIQFNDGSSMKY